MSILIKGMEMPKNCGECPFATPTRDGLMCDAVSFLAKCLAHPVSRMSCCPLIEFPPHGRLIDADKLRLLYDFSNYKPTMTEEEFDRLLCPLPVIRANIDDAPTIIESEGEE